MNSENFERRKPDLEPQPEPEPEYEIIHTESKEDTSFLPLEDITDLSRQSRAFQTIPSWKWSSFFSYKKQKSFN